MRSRVYTEDLVQDVRTAPHPKHLLQDLHAQPPILQATDTPAQA